MALPAWVQQTSGHASGAATLATSAFGSNTTAGNAIIVFVDTIAVSTNSVTNVVDSGGTNTYTRIESFSPHFDMEVWICQNIAGGTISSVTASLTGSNLFAVFAIEVSGLPTTGTIIDGFGTVTTTSTTATLSASTSLSTTNANDIVFGFFSTYTGSTGTWTVGSGYSNFNEVNSASGDPSAIESKVVAATGTQTATVTLPAGSQGVTGEGIVIAFSNTALGGGISPSSSLSPSSSISPSISPSASISPSSSISSSISPSASVSPSASLSPSSSASPSISPSASTSPSSSRSPSSSNSPSISPSASISPSSSVSRSTSPSASISPSSSISSSISPSASQSPSSSISPSISPSSSLSPSSSSSASISPSSSISRSISPSASASPSAPVISPSPINGKVNSPTISGEIVQTDSAPISLEG